MKRFFSTLSISLFLLVPVAGWPNTISIGGTALDIPNPPGFAAITPQMTGTYEFQKQFVPPSNEQFIAFMPELEVPQALRNEIPDLTRYFSVQTSKANVDVFIFSSDFSMFKQIIKTQNEEMIKEVEKNLPDLLGKVSEGINKKYDLDIAFSVSQMIPLPIHHKTDRTIAYSMFIKYNINDGSSNDATSVVAGTITFAHIKGKLFFLYSFAEESGLEWAEKFPNNGLKPLLKQIHPTFSLR